MPARFDQAELLDQGAGTEADVRANLAEMWRLNTLFGGLRSFTRYLQPRLQQAAQPLHIVDLGTGSGNLPTHLMRWAQQQHIQLQLYPFDLASRNLVIAQEQRSANPAIHLIQGDVLALPFAANSIDYYISSLFLHHFSPEVLIQVLRDSYRLARRGIIMNDLVRGYLPLAAFRLIQPVFARHFLTRHDGLLSIKRAYTAAELRDLARAAGIDHAQVYSHFPWRMTLVAEKSHV
ncbi:MAG: methyltransferase domain-containing protein [Armatimonadetes bacterium]|nr:methyltransferase domain-containing protein [Anaerolineae bacterium]